MLSYDYDMYSKIFHMNTYHMIPKDRVRGMTIRAVIRATVSRM